MAAAMLRTTATRSLHRSLTSFNATASRSSLVGNTFKAALTSSARPTKSPAVLSVALRKPAQKSLVRYQTTWSLDKEAEAELAKQKLVADPELVSIGSSVQRIIPERQSEPEKDVDMMAGIRSDFVRWLRVPTFTQLMVVI